MLEKITNSSGREEAIGRRFMGTVTRYALSVMVLLTLYSFLGCKKKEPVNPEVETNVEAIFSGNEEANSWSTPKKNCLLGLYYVEKGDIEQAMPLLNKAIELDPEYSRAYYGRGHAQIANGNQKEAIADFTQAIRYDPNNGEAYKYRARLLVETGEVDEALRDYDKVISLNPTSSTYCEMGIVLFQNGRYPEAEKAYNKAQISDPDNIDVYVNRGILFEKQGNTVCATADFDQALKMKPGDTFILYNRGCIYGKLGNMDLALADFNSVVANDPNHGMAHLNLAYIHKELGNNEMSEAALAKARKLKAVK